MSEMNRQVLLKRRPKRSYATPTEIGDIIEGRVVGRVARSRHPGFREGDFAFGG
jgi:NADPH-dependent curcumin reductase CurA